MRHSSLCTAGSCIALILAAGLNAGCAGGAAGGTKPNDDLLLEIRGAVPAAWRAAALHTPDIDPLFVSEPLQDFVRGRIVGEKAKRTRVLTLARAIFDHDGVALVYDDEATLTAADTFETGRGNCMGFSNLLVAAAREAGIDARYELVSNFQNWQRQGDLLVRTQHVRVVTVIRDERMVFDFYPDPVSPGSWSKPLSDTQARAHHYNNLAAARMQHGDAPGAFGLIMRALSDSPELSFVWSNLGALLSRQDMPALAEAAYKEAIRLDPNQMTALSNLQRLYVRIGRDADAAALEDTVRRYRERNPYFHFREAEQAYAELRYADALTHYRRAIRLKDNEREFHVGLARTYYKLGKKAAARRAIKRSHEIFTPEAATIMIRPSRR